MKLFSKIIGALVVAGFILPGASSNLPAAEYPNKTITYVVPFGAGGGTDRWARVLAGSAIDHFGQAFHVRNMPGASAVVGWKKMLARPADGYTLIQGSPTPILSLLLEKKPPIKPSQIKIVAYLSSFRAILTAKNGKKWSDWKGLAAYAKANPGKLTVGGSNSLLTGVAYLMKQAGLKITYVPYPSTGKAVADFLGGHINLLSATASTIKGLVPEKGTVVVNTSDLPLSKKIAKKLGKPPTAADLGYNGISFPRWVGVHPDTPDAIADAISVKLGKLLKAKSVKKMLTKMGEEVIYVPRKKAQAKYNQMVKDMESAVKLLK